MLENFAEFENITDTTETIEVIETAIDYSPVLDDISTSLNNLETLIWVIIWCFAMVVVYFTTRFIWRLIRRMLNQYLRLDI
jgi:cell fate (sporulation/competence/biofilm development) regulator YmcA (YheA/YmcA/DUF963 family)